MFYCEPCRVKKDWPESFSQSFGRCEICEKPAVCYDKASKFLPLPKPEPVKVIVSEKKWNGTGPARQKDRIDSFLELFTEAERASWAGRDNKPPTWVVLGVSYFLGEEPANKELMRRLRESGD